MMKISRLFPLLVILSLAPISLKSQSILDIEVKNINGGFISIDELKNDHQLIVLDFWATWCKPCVKSLPKVIKLSEEFKDKGVLFIGVNEDSPRNQAKIKPFVNTHGITYPVILDTEQEIMSELMVNAYPTLIIINSEGKVLYTHEGFDTGDEEHLKSRLLDFLSK